MNGTSGARRLLIASIAVVGAAFILRPQLSTTLLMRGDEFTAQNKLDRATTMYARALLFDDANGAAMDRLVFTAILRHDRTIIRGAISRASSFLQSHPTDAVVRSDRALAFQVLRDFRRAQSDFAQTGDQLRDARLLTFAALDAVRNGDRRQARRFLRRAVRYDRTFLPARRALERFS